MLARKVSNTSVDQWRRGAGIRVGLPLLVIAAGSAAYLSSFAGVFVLDDHRYIADNPRILQLWPPGEVFSGRRPVLDLSLALNYAFGKLDVWGYHAFNLLVHLAAALTLYGIVRRTLLRKPFRDRFGRTSSSVAVVVALLWVVHPLQTQSVTYLIQRSESLMGLFYLLTLYCVIRGVDSSPASRWYAAGVVFCAGGMGSKGVMVTAPLVVLLYDRFFLSNSFGTLLRRRWGFYLALAVTWGVLVACGVAQGVLSTSRTRATLGFSFQEITPIEYALTQLGVLVQYLKLSLWPRPLCLDYNWPVAHTAQTIVPQALVIAPLLVATLWACLRRQWLGFVGAWFFLILLPTSSFIPIKDPLFEHRMYLPLAAVILPAVVGASVTLENIARRLSLHVTSHRMLAVVAVAAAVISLGVGTARRNRVYHSELTMWGDVVAKRPDNLRAWYDLGTSLLKHDELDEAVTAFRQALRIDPRSSESHYNLGKSLSRQGRMDEAAEHYLETLRINPNLAEVHNDIGNILAKQNRFEEAISYYREAIRINPHYARTYFNLGNVLLVLGQTGDAVDVLREGVRISPETARIHYALGNALLKQGNTREAVQEYRETLRLDRDHAQARQALNAALSEPARPHGP